MSMTLLFKVNYFKQSSLIMDSYRIIIVSSDTYRNFSFQFVSEILKEKGTKISTTSFYEGRKLRSLAIRLSLTTLSPSLIH